MRRIYLLALVCLYPLAVFAQTPGSPATYNANATGNITATGATCATTNACVVVHLQPGVPNVAVTVTGAWSATLTMESSADNGNTWVSQGTVAANGQTTYALTAQTDFRVRCSAFTSGTAAVFINVSTPTIVNIGTAGSSSSGGTNGVNPSLPPYSAKFDVHRVKDATVASGSKVITCPNNDCDFLATARADGTMIMYCTNPTGELGGGNALLTALPSQIGKIVTITNNNSITTDTNSTASGTANNQCAWGDDDTNGSDALNGSWNAAADAAVYTGTPITYQMPAGATFFHKCLWKNATFPNNGTISSYHAPTFKGSGEGSTILIPLPLISQGGTFDLTTCPAGNASTFPGLVGPDVSGGSGAAAASYDNFMIDGLGNTMTGTDMQSRAVISSNVNGLIIMKKVTLVGWGYGATNMEGIRLGGQNSSYQDVNVDAVGEWACRSHIGAGTLKLDNMFCGDTKNTTLTALSNTVINSYSGVYGGQTSATFLGAAMMANGAGAVINSYGDGVVGTGNQLATGGSDYAFAVNGGSINLFGTKAINTATSGNGLECQAGSFMSIQGNVTATGGSGGFGVLTNATCKFRNLGANTVNNSSLGAGSVLLSVDSSLPVPFASLGTPVNGSFAFCSDCTVANPCAGSGTGAFAKRLNSIWVCN